MRLVLRGGLVATPSGMVEADVAIEDGHVTSVGPVDGGDETIDCAGCWVGPGFVDLHVHFREPGQTHKEDLASGSRAAAAGGFTAVVAMPNTEPAIDNPLAVKGVESHNGDLPVEITQAAAVTRGRHGLEPAPLSDLIAAGVRIFSDDGDWVADAGLLEGAMRMIASAGGVLVQHAEDRSITGSGIIHAGTTAARLGLAGIPTESEVAALERDLELVRRTGCAYHAQHLSAAASVEVIRAGKSEGLPVTAEVTPHHLTFDETDLGSPDPNFKMKPPLRTETDRIALVTALGEGTIDAVATDHAPHADFESQNVLEAPFGVVGLETAAAAVHTACRLPPEVLFDRMAVAPARIGRLNNHGRWIAAGVPANLVVFDPESAWTPHVFHSKSNRSPFVGIPLQGQVRYTIHDGMITYRREVE